MEKAKFELDIAKMVLQKAIESSPREDLIAHLTDKVEKAQQTVDSYSAKKTINDFFAVFITRKNRFCYSIPFSV